jgi:signal peptidase I
MSIPQKSARQASIIAPLYTEALRNGQSLWFRVVSNSMVPTLRIDDSVYIESTKANEIRVGEIAAFETPKGLVIHRIVRIQQSETIVRLLQMADVDLQPSWIEEQTVVGRVILVRHQGRQVNLQHSIAQKCGNITARLRYQLYLWKIFTPLRILSRLCSRLVVLASYLCIQSCCSTTVNPDDSSSIQQL